jgi:hypothetical protein
MKLQKRAQPAWAVTGPGGTIVYNEGDAMVFRSKARAKQVAALHKMPSGYLILRVRIQIVVAE